MMPAGRPATGVGSGASVLADLGRSLNCASRRPSVQCGGRVRHRPGAQQVPRQVGCDSPLRLHRIVPLHVGGRVRRAARRRGLRGRASGPAPQPSTGRLVGGHRVRRSGPRRVGGPTSVRRRAPPPLRGVRRCDHQRAVADAGQHDRPGRSQHGRGTRPCAAGGFTLGTRTPDRRPATGTGTWRVAGGLDVPGRGDRRRAGPHAAARPAT